MIFESWLNDRLGSLQFGWNGNEAYDGTSFAANQDVVLVATNYRTNGKFASRAL